MGIGNINNTKPKYIIKWYININDADIAVK